MNVQAVYEKYTIPPNLQKHMLRVAALSQIITENWSGTTLDKESVILTCLFHDMANIIKFNFTLPSLFKEEDSKVDYWKNIKEEYIQKYGPDVHQATQAIAKEIHLATPVLELMQKLEWENIERVVKNNEFASAITIYCDMHVGPHGILPIQERLDNLKTRTTFTDHAYYKNAAPLLEKKIQEYTAVSLSSINDEQLNSRFESLLKTEL